MISKVKIEVHGDRAIRITRSFKAPRELVFDAMSKPDMVKHWLHGPPGWTMSTCKMDTHAGGTYRWIWTNADGREMGMGGRIIELIPPDRMVTTERFDDAWYEGEATNTLILTEQNGVTFMSLTIEYASTKARDGVLASQMASGMDASYDRLDQYLQNA